MRINLAQQNERIQAHPGGLKMHKNCEQVSSGDGGPESTEWNNVNFKSILNLDFLKI